MSFYVHKSGKRGRPTRFDDKNLAVIKTIVTMLDERAHKRGRHPELKMLSVVDDGTVICITDTVTDTMYTVTDSSKVKSAHKAPATVKPVVRVYKRDGKPNPLPTDAPVPKADIFVAKKTIKPRVIDKIKKLGEEVELKKLDIDE
jgi:hypothetical protein